MADGVSGDAPAILARFGPNMPVACYVNGAYAWTRGQENEFARKVRISVEAGQPGAAKYARVIDVERGAAGPDEVPYFLHARAEAGHDDCTVYCSLSTVPDVLRQFGDGSLTAVPRWWLAWYWGQPGQPSAARVLAELHALTGVVLPPERLWACQYVSHAQWDLSAVYGPYDWSR